MSVVALLGAAVTADGQEAAGKKVALLIGVNKYEKRGFRDLEYAERDAEELKPLLEKAGYQVDMLTGSGEGTKRATVRNIQAAVEALLKDRTKHDLLLVALAGHGLQLEVAGPDGKLQSESFFCPCDAVREEPKTMLPMGKLFEDINRRGGEHNLVLVDACREDPTRGRGMDGSTVKTLPEGVAVLFGCRAGQKTFETKNAGGGHGVFFHFVLEGLRGKAVNEEGEVTWSRLAEYVSKRVRADAPAIVGDESLRQTPNLIANLGGDSPVLLRPKSRPGPDSFAGSRAGQEWDGNGLKMKFSWCPAGNFTMGSPKGETGRASDEDQVVATLSRGFWLGKFEVTQVQWKSVMGGQPWSGKEDVKEGDDFPATYVSWEDATKFCNELTRKERSAGRLPTGWEYRLPTEAQWEYACRAGQKTRFHFGDDEADLGRFAWFKENAWDVGEKYAHAIGTRRANDWGLHDVHGNVSEWCRDWYAEKLPGGANPEVEIDKTAKTLSVGETYAVPADDVPFYKEGKVVARLAKGTKVEVMEIIPRWIGVRAQINGETTKGWLTYAGAAVRVTRGGGYVDIDKHCRSGYRSGAQHNVRFDFLGMRVALVESRKE